MRFLVLGFAAESFDPVSSQTSATPTAVRVHLPEPRSVEVLLASGKPLGSLPVQHHILALDPLLRGQHLRGVQVLSSPCQA
eukprot:2530536-Rhodomonas_salina.1